MRILFAGEFAGFNGGVERYMYRTAAFLRGAGHRVFLLYTHPGRDRDRFLAGFDAAFAREDREGIPPETDCAVIHRVRNGADAEWLSSRLPTACFVHDHELYCPRRCLYFPFGRGNCHRAYSRPFCSVCGMLKNPHGPLLREARRCLADFPVLWSEVLRSSRKFIVLSSFMRGMLIRNGADPEKIRMVPPAVDAPEIPAQPDSSGPVRLVCSGQLIKGKGVDRLLESLSMVRGNYTLNILGSGAEEKKLSEMASFRRNVVFTAWTSAPEKILLESDAAVLPWRWQEPFGLVGPEAMACGLPLAGFDVGATGEYLIPGETGLLAPEGDLEAFAENLSALIADPLLRARLGANGRRFVLEHYSVRAALEAWTNLLSELRK